MKRKIIYYKDELLDDFANVTRNTIKIDENYKYVHKNLLWKFFEFVVYRIFIVPFALVYMKVKFRHKVINKKVLKMAKGRGYVMFGNHTLMAGDAFIPNLINLPRKTYTVVHPDNVSVSATRQIIEMCGALPLPDTLTATKNFFDAMKHRISKKGVIQIYPEAHVWPYYTKIRPFGSSSFKYPIKLDVPAFVLTNVFVKKKFSRVPKVLTFVDGPFVVDKSIPPKEQEKALRDIVYEVMCERVKNSTYEVFEYKKEVNE